MAESESPVSPAPPVPSSNVGVVVRALIVGVIMSVLGRMAAPVILAAITSLVGQSWFGRWLSGQALPAVLVAGVALAAGAAVARVSGRKAAVGVAAFAALTAASGVPQLMTQISNAAQDPRYAGGVGSSLGNIVIALGCVLLGGWLGASRSRGGTV